MVSAKKTTPKEFHTWVPSSRSCFFLHYYRRQNTLGIQKKRISNHELQTNYGTHRHTLKLVLHGVVSSTVYLVSLILVQKKQNQTSLWTGNSNGSYTNKHSSHFGTVRWKRLVEKLHSFLCKSQTNKLWNDAEMLLKSFWTGCLQMINELKSIL